MSIFSKNLRYLRKKGDHKQEEIALLFNKRANTVGNWENEKSEPNLTELMQLGQFFKVSVEDLLHTELESPGRVPASDKAGRAAHKAGSTHEPKETSPGHAANPDAFWLILRELRIISEKLDSFISTTESA